MASPLQQLPGVLWLYKSRDLFYRYMFLCALLESIVKMPVNIVTIQGFCYILYIRYISKVQRRTVDYYVIKFKSPALK